MMAQKRSVALKAPLLVPAALAVVGMAVLHACALWPDEDIARYPVLPALHHVGLFLFRSQSAMRWVYAMAWTCHALESIAALYFCRVKHRVAWSATLYYVLGVLVFGVPLLNPLKKALNQ
jgi:hypothetical protein